MQDGKPAFPAFDHGMGLFDPAGGLHDWDAGFAAEFCAAGVLLAPGVSLPALIEAAYGDDQQARADIAAAVARAPERPRAYDLHRADGRILHIQETQSQSGGFVRAARDVTAERGGVAISVASEEGWCTTGDPNIEAVNNFRVTADGAYDFEPMTQEMARLFGLSEDFDLSDWATFFSRVLNTAEEDAFNKAQVAEMVRTLEPRWMTVRILGHDERKRWIRYAMSPSREPDGCTLISCRIHDVTREKLAEDQLELVRAAVTHSTDTIMIVHTDADGVSSIVYVNQAFERNTGMRAAELLGRPVAEVSNWDQQSWTQILALVENGDEASLELPVSRPGADTNWLEVNVSIIERRSDGAFRWAVVSRNIDERRRVQADLRRALEDAEAASRAKGEFLTNMSHEIRTPLTGVIGFAELMGQIDGLPELARRYLQRIQTGGQSLLAVVNDVLDFSKLEAGEIELDAQMFAPADLVLETVDLFTAQARAKGLEVTAVVAPDVPAYVRADRRRISQVLLNLVNNAIKFTAKGRVTVTLAHSAALGQLRIEVADTGVGVPEDLRDRLFQRFSQVDGSISRKYGGSGLGLAISRGLAEVMGGEIGVVSAAGEGSTFWFTVAAPIAAAPVAVVQLIPASPCARPARILIVDDVTANRELMRAMLEPFSYQVEEADRGAAAVEAAIQSTFDLILMDLQMPGMDGFEAAKIIRAKSLLNRDTPIVAVSANVLPAHLEACEAAGMNDHLGKPINPAEFLAKAAYWTSLSTAVEPSAASAA